MLLRLFLLLTVISFVSGDFTPDFGNWLEEHFGKDVRVNLER